MPRLAYLTLVAIATSCGRARSTPVASIARPPPPPPGADASRAAAAPPRVEVARTAPTDLAQLLDAHGLVRLTVVDPPCGDGDVRIVSGEDARGAGATCHGGTGAPPVCGAFAGVDPGHLTDVVCRHPEALRSVATPAWAAVIADAVDDAGSVTSVAGAGAPVLFVTDERQATLLVRAPGGWRAVDLGDADSRPQVTSAITGGRLAGAPVIGIEVDRYDGGSEMGQEWADLHLITVGDRVALVDTVPVMAMRWILPAERRAGAGPTAATDRRARPHVEVALASSFDREGRLVLTVARQHLLARLPASQRDWFRCDPDGADDDACGSDDPATAAAACRASPGGLPALEALAARAGRWRLTAAGVQRDP